MHGSGVMGGNGDGESGEGGVMMGRSGNERNGDGESGEG